MLSILLKSTTARMFNYTTEWLMGEFLESSEYIFNDLLQQEDMDADVAEILASGDYSDEETLVELAVE